METVKKPLSFTNRPKTRIPHRRTTSEADRLTDGQSENNVSSQKNYLKMSISHIGTFATPKSCVKKSLECTSTQTVHDIASNSRDVSETRLTFVSDWNVVDLTRTCSICSTWLYWPAKLARWFSFQTLEGSYADLSSNILAHQICILFIFRKSF